jgi:iron(III) transport system ATP-binding protein
VLEFLKAGQAVRVLTRAPSERGRAGVAFVARLTFEDVSKRYGANLALDNVSLDVLPRRGAVPARALRLRQDHAAQDCRGRGAANIGPRAARWPGGAGPDHFVPPQKRGVGPMFQDFALFPHPSILQNVALGSGL